MPPLHPADAAGVKAIEQAAYFTVSLLTGGRHETIALSTLALARQARPLFEELHGGARRAIIYAVTPEGRSHVVPNSYQPPMGDLTMSMLNNSATASKPNGKVPYAGKEARKASGAPETAEQRAKRGFAPLEAKGPAKGAKLPVPPRKAASAKPEAAKPPVSDMVKAFVGEPGRGVTAPAPKGVKPEEAAAIAAFTLDPKKEGIPAELQVQNRKPASPETLAKLEAARKIADAKAAEKKAAASVKAKAASAPKAKSSDGRKLYDWKGAEAAALKGKLPAAPDFSADTHTRFRPALAEVEGLAKAGNLAGLKKWKWEGFVSSSPKAILRFRDICVTALTRK